MNVNDVSFSELVSRYAADRRLRPRSVTTYTGVVRTFQRYLGCQNFKPSMVTRGTVIDWRVSILCSHGGSDGISESSWNNYARHLKALYNYGIKHRIILCASNPFADVFVRQPQKAKRSLQPLQIKFSREILNDCRCYESYHNKCSKLHPAWFWQAVAETFFFTGIRLNQLLHIEVGDIDLGNRTLRASAAGSKTYRESILPIPDALCPYISELIVAAHASGFKRDDQLFNVNRFSYRHRRTTMSAPQVEHFFKALSVLAGSKITPHRYRHYLGTSLMENPDRNIHIAQNVLNHTDIRTTLEYVQSDVEAMRRALNARSGF